MREMCDNERSVSASLTLGSLRVEIVVRRRTVAEEWPKWSVYVNDGHGGEVSVDAKSITSATTNRESPTSVVDDLVLSSLGFNSREGGPSNHSELPFIRHYPSSNHPFQASKMRRTNENNAQNQNQIPQNRSILDELILSSEERASWPTDTVKSVTKEEVLPDAASDCLRSAGDTDAHTEEDVQFSISEKCEWRVDDTDVGLRDPQTKSFLTTHETEKSEVETQDGEPIEELRVRETHLQETRTLDGERLRGLLVASNGGTTQREVLLLSADDAAFLKTVQWPQMVKTGSELPTLYCHLCYLREKAFKKIEATSPHGNRVYFRHRACNTSYGNGEAFPRSLVNLYVTHFLSKRQSNSKRKS